MENFTLTELNKLVQACDIATKAGGLQVASELLPIVAKIQDMASKTPTSNNGSALDAS